jgi:hypothetical protein
MIDAALQAVGKGGRAFRAVMAEERGDVADDYRIIDRPWSSPPQAATGSSVRSLPSRCGWVVLPSLLIGVPAAFRKQAVDIGQRAVATNEEPQPFGVSLARPAPVPRFATGIVRIEPDALQRLPAAMRTAFHVTPFLVLLADRRTTVGAMISHPARLRRCVRIGTTLSVGSGLNGNCGIGHWLADTMNPRSQSNSKRLAGRFTLFR